MLVQQPVHGNRDARISRISRTLRTAAPALFSLVIARSGITDSAIPTRCPRQLSQRQLPPAPPPRPLQAPPRRPLRRPPQAARRRLPLLRHAMGPTRLGRAYASRGKFDGPAFWWTSMLVQQPVHGNRDARISRTLRTAAPALFSLVIARSGITDSAIPTRGPRQLS